MRTRRNTIIAVVAVVIIAAAAVVTGADLPQASLSPDRVLKGTETKITITVDKDIQKQISSVRVGGHPAIVQKPGAEGKLSALLPKLDIVGQADVEVVGKGNKPVAVGQLTYVAPAEPSPLGSSIILLCGYVLLICLLPVSCTIYDIHKSYQERSTVFGLIKEKPTIDEIKSLLANMDQGPTGFTGLTRGIVANTLILVLAIAVFHLVVFAPKVPDLAEKLLMLLAGTLTAITGFYFGSKAATTANTPADSGGGKFGAPKISRVDPISPSKNAKLKVIGEGFGAQQGKGTLKFRDDKGKEKEIKVADGSWNDTQIEVTVPDDEPTGTVNIIVTNDNGKASEPFSFTIT